MKEVKIIKYLLKVSKLVDVIDRLLSCLPNAKAKNNHVIHNAFLEYVMLCYEDASIINFNEIKHVISHIDNYLTQCKCRQNFVQLAAKN